MLTLGTLTDVAVLTLGGSHVEDLGDHVVVSTPANPSFHWGNFFIVLEPAADPDRWLPRFQERFPAADHRCFVLPDRSCDDAWICAGLEVSDEDALSSLTPPSRTPTPHGYDVRPIQGSDWEAYVAAELLDNQRTGRRDPALFNPYVRAQAATRERLSRQGVAHFLGAFIGNVATASLGIVLCPPIQGHSGLARFQHVQTDADHRRRGLARHLLGEAGRWAAAAGATEFVIVAEHGSDASRLYQSAGFVEVSGSHQAERA